MKRISSLVIFFLGGILWAPHSVAQPTLTPPDQTYVLRFGGRQLMIAPDSPLLKFGRSFTMAGWFYLESANPGDVLMGHLLSPGGELGAILEVTNAGSGHFMFALSDGSPYTFIFSHAPASLKTWTHVAGVLENGTMRLFINGIQESSTTFNGTPAQNVTRFSVGAGCTDPPEPLSPMTGFASHVSVWNKALSQSEIHNIAANDLVGTESGLVAYWKLDDAPESYNAKDFGANKLDLRMDQTSYQPLWADKHPLQYPMEAIANPYFVVHEQVWPEFSGMNATTQDAYAINLTNDEFTDAIVSFVDFASFQEEPLHALKNNGDFTFTDVTTTKLGTVTQITPRFGQVADINNDGVDDLYIADTGPDRVPFVGHQNTLLFGNLTGKMTDASRTNIPLIKNACHGLSIGDIDHDGDLDIVTVQQPRPDTPGVGIDDFKPDIFVNDGMAHFTLDNSRLPASSLLYSGSSVHLVDIDRDEVPEAFLAVDYIGETPYHPRSAMIMLKNDGKGYFSFPKSGDMINNEFYNQESVQFVDIKSADFNHDGFMDIVAIYTFHYQGSGLMLFKNDGDGTFTKIGNAFPSKLLDTHGNDSAGLWIQYIRLGDFNNDGWPDVYCEGGNVGDFLFLNNGNNTFTNASYILTPKQNSWGSISNVADFNNDGRLDIFSVSNGKIQLLQNVRDVKTITAQPRRRAVRVK